MARTPKAQALGVALRRAREKGGLTTRDMADRTGRNHGEISRWETGDRTPKPEYVAQILATLGIVGKPYDEIMSLTYDTTAPLWVASTLPAQRQQLAAIVEMEQRAVAITDVVPSFVPGLLQTRDYAHAIMSGGGLTPDEIETRVSIRMERQDVITRANPARLTAFIGEAAIYQFIGDQSVTVAQLRHLLKMAQLRNVALRVMPFDMGWHPGIEGAFKLVWPRDSAPIVHVELRRTTLFLHEDDDVNAYREALGMIDKVALAPESSIKLITARMESLS